jgi:cytochrome P450
MASTPVPAITPMPAIASAHLPWIGSGSALLRDPTAFFARCRRRLGETFVVDAFGYRLFCVFSAPAVRALYALPERFASKGFADYALLRHKIPDELFHGRRNFPHHLFGNQEVETYLDHVAEAVDGQLDELGGRGRFDAFAFTRRLGHRVGLASWGGVAGASAHQLDRLIPHFDALDASESFVHPWRGVLAWATDKRRERTAMAAIEAVMGEVLDRRGADGTSGDLFGRIVASWGDAPVDERVAGIARDVMLIHMGSQSNLFAAMAWTLVNVLARPELAARVRAGDAALVERCAHESIRMAQRSITLRRVLQPVVIDDGTCTYRVEPDAFVTTMLSSTNTSAAADLDRFDPDRYDGHRLRDVPGLATRELVSTFGHGRHSCPARRFSISAIRIALLRLWQRYELEPRWRGSPRPLRMQLGGVARARGCTVAYRARG